MCDPTLALRWCCPNTIGTKQDFIRPLCHYVQLDGLVTKLSQDLVLQIPVTTQIRPAVDHSARPFCPRDLKTSKISIGDLNAVSPDTFSGSRDSVTLTIEREREPRPYLVFVVITLSVINVRPIPDKCG